MEAPSRFRSLRWQLPLSYAAIALLAVVALGIVLLGTLRRFYRQQELAYLTDNAVAIAEEIAPLMVEGQQTSLEARIAGYAFLIQTRIEVLGRDRAEILADSGEAALLSPAISVGIQEEIEILEPLGAVAEEVVIVVEKEETNSDGQISSQRIVTRTSSLPAQGSLYGFTLGGEPGLGAERSNSAVEVPIKDISGDLIGTLRLSQGPAYGRDILRNVAWGWAVAGIGAVFLAALGGWLVSRRLTRPLSALTHVTARMADGDLGARAAVQRTDELGFLGFSFNRMAEQVESTVNSLRQFTADAAHELHTPLTALQTDLQLLAEHEDPQQQRRVQRAQVQAQRLQGLTESLLELSLLQAEMNSRPHAIFNLTYLVKMMGELYASRAEQSNLNFDLILPRSDIMISGDESQLQRAVANILTNSLKFTPAPGQIDLTLTQDNDFVLIIVQDSGIGIRQEDIPLLFNRFHRGRNTVEYPGSGLGLAIVQEIMLRHNGRVAVDSGEWGTKVQLILPRDY
ncbi:MAG: HAMP domain-containing sensor histidine kinase [Candidatus Promineifilaceae bacterium]|nr:HAMP domain-containing sensor histidine kinase [Candidatus Promineifilaceae bacterium]